MADPKRPFFYLGLNMPGAVSAGAYTAGVMDFLIDALDTWYAERERQRALYGDDFEKWDIPAHEVRLFVMAGASAGGMTSAVTAAALCEEFTPVRAIPAAGTPPPNRLYKSWVTDIDMQYLLGANDLSSPRAKVESFLDSTRLDTIAGDALRVSNPLPAPRRYVADPLKVIVSLTNLKGIPYAIEENSGSAETQTLYHADQQSFQISWTDATSTAGSLTLSPHRPDGWPALQEAAQATGSFPFALKARTLTRTTQQYKQQRWRLSADDASAQDCQCEKLDTLEPAFGDLPDRSFLTLNVDGGVTNNNPFDCTNNELSQAAPARRLGRCPTSALEADRAVISIAPFLSAPQFSLNDVLDSSLFAVIPQLLDAVVNQSRISGENIKLTRSSSVYSAFHVSPSIDNRTVNALASASLGAFGGFIAQAFRDHDYQLGRRNCQWFLQQYFGLPFENVVMGAYAPNSAQARNRILDQFGMNLSGGRGVALIPLLGKLREEIRVQDAQIDPAALPPLVDQAAARIKLIAARLLDQYQANLLTRAAFRAAWLVLESKLKRRLLSFAAKGLARQNLLS